MQRCKILVVEDDKEISDSIAIYLGSQNYDVIQAFNGIEALDVFQEQKIDLVIMDLMMPLMDGEETTKRIREKSYVPIIMLSAKSEDQNKIMGLNIGADDYITKPFNPMELIARVNSCLRRYRSYGAQPAQNNVIEIGGVVLDKDSKKVSVEGEDIKVTPIEFKIMELLMEHPGKVFSSEEIYERVWDEPALSTNTVTVHVRRIREKIEIDPKKPQYLKVVWGIGYKFADNRA